MSIASLLATGAAATVLNLIKGYITSPKINGIPIQATRFQCVMEAEVSRHVLINLNQGLQNVMDNVAPGPRTWEIEGYIGGFLVEVSSLYMPSLMLMTNILDVIFNSRQTCTLIDPNFHPFTVMMSRFQYSAEPDIQNRVPVRISLIEITVLTVSTQTGSPPPTDQANAMATPGQPFGPTAIKGNAANLSVGLPPGVSSTAAP